MADRGRRPADPTVSADSGLHWSEPGAWAVADGVWRIPLPLPSDALRAVNVYVLETDDGLTLVDGGWALEESRRLLERSLREAGHALGDVRRFLVTHVHRDHYTQAVTVRREVGAHVSLGVGDRPTLDLIHGRRAGEEDPYVPLLRAAGAPAIAARWRDFTSRSTPDLSLWEYPDTWLEDDHEIGVGGRTLDAVSTPGHTRGHYVFADREDGLLFAGDHVLPTITPSIGFEPAPSALPLRDFLASLAKVRALPDARLLPAHGPVTASVHARVDELVAHHDQRLSRIATVVRGIGPCSAHDVARELGWTRRERPFADLDLFNQALAVLETRVHLELLAAGDQLVREEGEGAVGYAARPGASAGSRAPSPRGAASAGGGSRPPRTPDRWR
jgi:glyoxylase-like metal-dependent hydrolase (beta-lactamase superfamily II)